MEDLVPYRRGLAYVLLRQKPFTGSLSAVPFASELHLIFKVDTTSS